MEHAIREKRELKYKGTIVDVYEDSMRLPNGKIEHWDYVAHRKGAAAVLPVREDGRILLVKQYRNALERMTLELPAGSRDSITEEMEVCARRELEEETGYQSRNMTFLIRVHTTVAFCNEKIDVFLARDLVPGTRHLDPGEAIGIVDYSIEELQKMIYAGELQDSKTIAAIMTYACMGE